MTIAKEQHPVLMVGDRLLRLRRKHGLTQAEFAARLAVPKSTYVAWERNEAEPPFRLIASIQRALGHRSAAEAADLYGSWEGTRSIDWISLARVCSEVEALAKRAGYAFEIADIVEIAGIIFERGDDIEVGLRDAEQLLRIGKRLSDVRA